MIGETTRNEFDRSIRSLAEFTGEWKSYLERTEVDEEEMAATNDSALELIKKAEWNKEKLTSFIFNKKMIMFMKNDNVVEMGNIGVVKFKSVFNKYDLNEFRQIDIKDVVNRGKNFQVLPQNDGTFCLLYTSAGGWYDLNQVCIDKEKNFISANTFNTGSNNIYQFRKHNDNIFISYHNGKGFQISKLNSDMSVVKSVNVDYRAWCLSATDSHVYSFYKNHLHVYNFELVLIKQVGQANNPSGPFYLPTGIKQLEVNKGKFYWLNNTNLQILKEGNG